MAPPPLVGVTVKVPPLQMVVLKSGIEIPGTTVIVTVNVGPTQPLALGVTVYTTVLVALLLLVNVPDIELPLPLTSPVTLVLSTTVQL